MKIHDKPDQNGLDVDPPYKFKPGFFEKWFNALLCRCDVNEEQIEIEPVGFFELFRFGSKTDKIYVTLAILCGFIAGMGYTFPYFISGKLVTVLIEHGDKPYDSKLLTQGFPYMGLDLICAVSTFVLTFFQNFLLKKACTNMTATLRIEFIKALLRQDAKYLDKQKFGVLNNQLTENIDTIRDGIGEKVGLVVRGISALFGSCLFCAVINWKIFLINFGAAPVSIVLMSFMGRLVSVTAKKTLPFNEKAASILQESVINVKTLQCCNGEEEMVDKYNKALKDGRGYSVLAFVWSGFFDGTTFLFLYLFYMLAFYYGAVMAFRGELSSGDVFIVPNAFFGAAYYLAIVSPHFVSILKARVACAKIYAQIDRIPITAGTEKGLIPNISGGKIEFHKVEFGYAHSRKILKGLSFTAEAGSVVALVGKSGCGKSTCMSILTRLYDCSSGYVSIDGLNVKDINVKALRKLIGIVQQEPVLFTGTIKENIRLGDESITDNDIEAACRTANAHDFIQALSDGYDTLIGQGAVKLSGGQKQRIAIARAIVNDPRILLLDEATSALDVNSECHVQEALNAASAGRTTIVIAHRLSTLRDAKKIVVIDEGVVIEEGTHLELRAQQGVYEKLVKAQEFKEATQKPQELEDVIEIGVARSRLTSTLSEKDHFIPQSSGRFPSTRLSLTTTPQIDPTQFVVPSKVSRHGLLSLYKNTTENRGKLTIATIFALFRGAELSLFVLALNSIFLSLAHKTSWPDYQHKLVEFSAYCLALGVFSFITICVPTIFYGWASECIVDVLKVRSLASVLRRDATYFDQPETSNAKIIAKINSDASQLKPAFDNRMLHLINNIFAIMLLLIQAVIFSWQIVLVGTIVTILMTLFMLYFGSLAHKKQQIVAQLDDSANISVEIIENIRTIQLLTQEDYFARKFADHTNRATNEIVGMAKHESVVLAVGMASAYICDFVSYSTGIPLIYNGLITPNACFVAAMNVCMISWAIQFASMAGIDLMQVKPAAESFLPIIDEDVDNNGKFVDPSKEKRPNKDIKGLVEVKKLQFAYPARPQVKVANGLNLRIEPRTTVALVGPSGGGKSTIIQLLERLYVEQEGTIIIDGQDIDSFNLKNLRSQMALVGQEPVLFSGSIIDNITLGVENATIGDVKHACEVANASHFIEKLPLGYDTETGEKGAQLSGGQKQRIAIARAMIRKPKILLLDEATSALDAESERAIQEALDKASESRTCITIAHRLSSIQHSDRIYFIENGRVVESGTHDQLIESEGKYAKLVQKQLLA